MWACVVCLHVYTFVCAVFSSGSFVGQLSDRSKINFKIETPRKTESKSTSNRQYLNPVWWLCLHFSPIQTEILVSLIMFMFIYWYVIVATLARTAKGNDRLHTKAKRTNNHQTSLQNNHGRTPHSHHHPNLFLNAINMRKSRKQHFCSLDGRNDQIRCFHWKFSSFFLPPSFFQIWQIKSKNAWESKGVCEPKSSLQKWYENVFFYQLSHYHFNSHALIHLLQIFKYVYNNLSCDHTIYACWWRFLFTIQFDRNHHSFCQHLSVCARINK